jgi:RNA polymerase sigma-70 factor, ECF subfamily
LMMQLEPGDRQALELVELEGLTQAATASRLGLSVSGMKSRVQRARRRLRAALDDCCQIVLDGRGGVVSFEHRAGDCGPCGPGDTDAT